MAYSVDFSHFNYYIMALFAEYFDDIPKPEYLEKLTHEWWLKLHSGVLSLLDAEEEAVEAVDLEKKSINIPEYIWEKVMAEFEPNFLNAEQTKELKYDVYDAFNDYKIKRRPLHYCKDPSCDGDCGVQRCGWCIDCCRCRY